MKRLALLLCLVLCLPLTAQPDDTTKRAKVREMLNLLHMDQRMDQVMGLVEQQATAMTNARLTSKGANANQKERADTFQKQLFTYIESQIGWKAMQSEYVDMYSQTFTEEEIDAMIVFYKSPAGVALVAKSPELTQKASVLVQKKMLTLTPELQKMVQDFASTAAKPRTGALDTN